MVSRLIHLVRQARERDHRYISIDKDNKVYTSNLVPTPGREHEWVIPGQIDPTNGFRWTGGRYHPPCHWSKTLIDVTKLRGIK